MIDQSKQPCEYHRLHIRDNIKDKLKPQHYDGMNNLSSNYEALAGGDNSPYAKCLTVNRVAKRQVSPKAVVNY